MAVALEHFVVDGRVDFYGIFLHEVASGLIVAFALYALDFAEQTAEKGAQFPVIVDADVGLSVALYVLYDVVGLAMLVGPPDISLRLRMWASSTSFPGSIRMSCVIRPLRMYL